MPSLTRILRAQALFLGAGGVWPLLNMQTFEAVTGPKADTWLVRTVGILLAVIASVLAAESVHPRSTTVGLAAGTSLGLAAVDVREVARGRISRVYLLDALAQVAFIAALLARRVQAS